MTPAAPQRVLVTGGTTGIGAAIAERLLASGSHVFIVGRDEDTLRSAMTRMSALPGRIDGINADLAYEDGVYQTFAAVRKQLGGLDALVCNAGIAADGINDMDDESWRYAIQVNLMGYLACVRASMPLFGATGRIVLVGSLSAEEREKDSSVYVATKSGVRGFAEALRKEVSEHGLHVALIEPGSVKTEMHDGSEEELEAKVAAEEMLRPEDVAECVDFVLTRPQRCDVVELRVRPHRESE